MKILISLLSLVVFMLIGVSFMEFYFGSDISNLLVITLFIQGILFILAIK